MGSTSQPWESAPSSAATTAPPCARAVPPGVAPDATAARAMPSCAQAVAQRPLTDCVRARGGTVPPAESRGRDQALTPRVASEPNEAEVPTLPRRTLSGQVDHALDLVAQLERITMQTSRMVERLEAARQPRQGAPGGDACCGTEAEATGQLRRVREVAFKLRALAAAWEVDRSCGTRGSPPALEDPAQGVGRGGRKAGLNRQGNAPASGPRFGAEEDTTLVSPNSSAKRDSPPTGRAARVSFSQPAMESTEGRTAELNPRSKRGASPVLVERQDGTKREMGQSSQISTRRLSDVYRSWTAVSRAMGRSPQIAFAAFAERLRRHAQVLGSRHGAEVEFQVVLRGARVQLQPVIRAGRTATFAAFAPESGSEAAAPQGRTDGSKER